MLRSGTLPSLDDNPHLLHPTAIVWYPTHGDRGVPGTSGEISCGGAWGASGRWYGQVVVGGGGVDVVSHPVTEELSDHLPVVAEFEV